MRFVGLERTKKKFDLYVDRAERGTDRGLVKAALLAKKVSQQNTPRRTGNLANSAFVTTPKGPRGTLGAFKGDDAAQLASDHAVAVATGTAEVSARSRFGRKTVAVGYSAIYAQKVHENPAAGAVGFGGEADLTDQNLNRLRAEDVHSAVGGWKFLFKGMEFVRGKLRGMIATEIRLSR